MAHASVCRLGEAPTGGKKPLVIMLSKESIKEALKDISSVLVQLYEQDWEFLIWESDKLYERNHGYKIEEYLPGYFAIGSDGGGEMLAIELSTGLIYSIPFIPMDSTERIKVSDSLADLIKKITDIK